MAELKYEVLPDGYEEYNLSFKIIVIGDPGVGKSCLTLKATKNYFENYYSPTVGFEFFTISIKINDKVIRLQIWDTCGQETYRSLINSFYRNASLAILVYSIEDNKTFSNLGLWLNEIRQQANPDEKIFLIGNKADLEDKREVTFAQANKFYKENNIHFFIETSAKTGLNAQAVFVEAAKILYQEHLKYKTMTNPDQANNISIKEQDLHNDLNDDEDMQKKKKKKCC